MFKFLLQLAREELEALEVKSWIGGKSYSTLVIRENLENLYTIHPDPMSNI